MKINYAGVRNSYLPQELSISSYDVTFQDNGAPSLLVGAYQGIAALQLFSYNVQNSALNNFRDSVWGHHAARTSVRAIAYQEDDSTSEYSNLRYSSNELLGSELAGQFFGHNNGGMPMVNHSLVYDPNIGLFVLTLRYHVQSIIKAIDNAYRSASGDPNVYSNGIVVRIALVESETAKDLYSVIRPEFNLLFERTFAPNEIGELKYFNGSVFTPFSGTGLGSQAYPITNAFTRIGFNISTNKPLAGVVSGSYTADTLWIHPNSVLLNPDRATLNDYVVLPVVDVAYAKNSSLVSLPCPLMVFPMATRGLELIVSNGLINSSHFNSLT